ncbi:MAG: hypothetical protein ACT4OF_00015 [Caulobacteraceae bacterium]
MISWSKSALVAGFMCLVIGDQAAAQSTDAAPFQFVQGYIRAIGRIESIRRAADEQGATAPADCVRTMTRFRLEMIAEAEAMSSIELVGLASGANNQVAEVLRRKAQIYSHFVEVCAALMRGPERGVDYGALGARLPQYTAQLEFLDDSLLQFTPVVFSALLDTERPNAQDHVDRLVISGAERRVLIDQIDRWFVPGRAARGNYMEASAAVLRSHLTNTRFKSADDP